MLKISLCSCLNEKTIWFLNLLKVLIFCLLCLSLLLFFSLYFIQLAPGWFMCILFVPLLINKSWHLAVLSFSWPPSSLPLHLDSFSSTTCLLPLFYSATFFCTLTLSSSACTAVFLRLWLGPARRSGHTVPSDAMPQSCWDQHKPDMQNQLAEKTVTQEQRKKYLEYLSSLLFSLADFDGTT